MENDKHYTAVIFRLHPTPEQETLFRKNCGCRRFVKNAILAAKKENHELYLKGKKDKSIPTEAELKKEYEWLSEVDANSLVQARRDAETAFKNCFKHGFGYPKFEKKGKKDCFRVIQMNEHQRIPWIYAEDTNQIRIGKHGLVRASGDWSCLIGRIKSITVKLDAGRWYGVVLQELTSQQYYQPVNHTYDIVGIDLGVVRPLTITNGSEFWLTGKEAQTKLKKLEVRRKRYQRQVRRKQQGSKNRAKAQHRVQKAFQHERFVRKDWIEKTSDKLTKTAKKIVFEDLKLGNMTKSGKGKHGLNRELLRLGISKLIKRTEDKACQRGGEVIFVDPKYTSQICSSCGVKDKQSRKSQSRYCCVSCGFMFNADKNAALNILARGLA